MGMGSHVIIKKKKNGKPREKSMPFPFKLADRMAIMGCVLQYPYPSSYNISRFVLVQYPLQL